MIIPLIIILGAAIYSGKYVRGVVDFLAAGRVAGRYVISVGDLTSGLSVITLVALVEAKYQTGYGVEFWGKLTAPLGVVFALTGYCVYRWRETKALSFGQFLEMRYNRAFRIFASALRTISEMITNALGPAIAVNFFIYFLGLPHSVSIFGLSIPCFTIILILLMAMAMVCIWPGGRVSLIITDTFQGLLCYPVFVIIVGYILLNISWDGEIAPTMMDRVPGENFINPYDVSKLRDFNIFSLVVTLFANILNRASWFGNDSSNSARTPHEQKMAGILGAWRSGFSYVMLMVIAVMVITIMNHQNFSGRAKNIRDTLVTKAAEETIADPVERAAAVAAGTAIPERKHQIGVDAPLSRTNNLETPIFEAVHDVVGRDGDGNLTFQRFRTIYQQMMMSITLRQSFPVGLLGLFGLLMIMLVLSTDDSRIFNASSTILQDVIMPFRKTPLTPKQHLLWLRLCSLGVALFFVTFSMLFVQLDYINMFVTIMCSIWLGGAGPVMIGGLYSRFGNTTGAFAAIFAGSGISISGIFLQSHWAKHIYPFLVEQGWDAPLASFLSLLSSPFEPFIVWEMTPEKFPINSYEIYFIAMVSGIAAYIIGSLVTYKGPYNLDRLLHRGIYSIDGEKQIKSAWTWGNVWNKLIGITPEYTRGDRIIAWSVFFYSFVYQLLISFVLVVIWNVISPWPVIWWKYYFWITTLVIPSLAGIVTTVWFCWGGLRDAIRLFRDLEARVDNPLDDGRVSGQVSVADLAALEKVEEKEEKK